LKEIDEDADTSGNLVINPVQFANHTSHSSNPWISFFEKTNTIEAEKSIINPLIIIDMRITFHE
jgi:hypothetical protein